MAGPKADDAPSPLKLLALDEDDLKIVSAHLQDAVTRADNIHFERDAKSGRLVVSLNRFVWEERNGRLVERFRGAKRQRRRSILHFESVLNVRSVGFTPGSEAVLSLLAVLFEPEGAGPEGTVELVFSGDAEMQIDVAALEVRLTDTEAAWAAGRVPRHKP